MDLPGIWGWLVLVVIAVGIGALARIRYGWVAICAMVFVISAMTFGYSIGFDEGVDRAAAAMESPREACEIEFDSDAAAIFRRAVACNSAWEADRYEAGAASLSAWLGAGALGLMGGCLMLLLMEVLPRFAREAAQRSVSSKNDSSDADHKAGADDEPRST